MEFNAEQQKRKERGYQLHRNVRASPGLARSTRADLAKRNLHIPEFENLDDQAIAVLISNWYMEYMSRLHGSHAGVEFGEEYYLMEEFLLPSGAQVLPQPKRRVELAAHANRAATVKERHHNSTTLCTGFSTERLP